ncbi:hypothetical protein V2J09_021471 [Rumex salicifolius]
MESASSSVLCNSYFPLNQNHAPFLINSYRHVNLSHPPLSLSTACAAGNLGLRPRVSNFNRLVARSSPSDSYRSDNDCSSSGELFAIILEVDGVLLDAYRSGNRMAFNVAFKKLGLDCANWSKPVYSDLVRKAAGDEERMLILFFNRIGWPTSLPTTEREAFVQKVIQEKKNAIDELVISNDLPLRPGVEKFIDDAISEGIPVAVLTSSSNLGEKLARVTVERLGQERISKIKIIGNQEVEKSSYGQIVFGQLGLSGIEDEIASEASKAVAAEKKRIAEQVASRLQLRVDFNELTAESMQKIVAAIRAATEYAGVSVPNSVLVAGTRSTIAAAERVGMPYVVLCNSLTPRSAFPSAKAVMDGFGDVDLTVSKLRSKCQS